MYVIERWRVAVLYRLQGLSQENPTVFGWIAEGFDKECEMRTGLKRVSLVLLAAFIPAVVAGECLLLLYGRGPQHLLAFFAIWIIPGVLYALIGFSGTLVGKKLLDQTGKMSQYWREESHGGTLALFGLGCAGWTLALFLAWPLWLEWRFGRWLIGKWPRVVL